MQIKVKKLHRRQDGCVTRVFLECSKTVDDYTAIIEQDIGIAIKDPNDPTFISYDNLTEDIVKSWFSDPLLLKPIEEILDREIEKQKSPPIVEGLPW